MYKSHGVKRMQLIEVKNNTAKIKYNPSENYLLPADFLLIEDENQKLVAQVTGFETSQNKESIANVRQALFIDKDDNISGYNGYIPSPDSKVMYLNAEEIVELIEGSGEKIFLGSLANKPDCFIKPDISFIDEKLYIRSDSDDAVKTIVENLLYQTDTKNKRSVLFDFDGSYDDLKKVKRLKVSQDFRLPLNINAFDTILEYDTKECPVADKAVIQSIVLELREYLKTLEDGYLPFTAFKNVIDSEFEENQIPGLMLLKNKLCLYSQDNVFADKKEEFDVIDDAFFNNNVVVIDASSVEEKWYKFVIQSVIERLTMKTYLFLSLNEINADKKFLVTLYKNNYYIPVISTTYNSKYSGFLTQNAKNQILCKPQDIYNDSQPYSPLLNKINDEEFIIYGNATYRLPLLLNYQSFGENTAEEIIQNEIKKDVDKFFNSQKNVLPQNNTCISDSNIQKTKKSSDNDVTDDDLDFLDKDNETVSNKTDDWNDDWNDEWKDDWQDVPPKANERVFELMPVENDFDEDENFEETGNEENPTPDELDLMFEEDNASDDETSDVSDDIEISDDADETGDAVLVFEDEDNEEEYDCIVLPEEESVEENLEDDDCIILSDDEVNEKTVEEDDDSLILPETEEMQENNLIIENDDNDADDEQTSIIFDDEEDEETDTVLSNIIDDIESRGGNNDFETDEEQDIDNITESEIFSETAEEIQFDDEEVIEEEEKEEILPPEINENISDRELPDVKVYETDVPEGEADASDFKAGDRVYHPKHGYGVIEGFANYSNKIMFCQIEFENVGRRILDPKVSNLQKA